MVAAGTRSSSTTPTLSGLCIGLVLVIVGLLWSWISRLGLGRLPGDVVIERGNFHFYFPIATCILVSAVLSFIVWLLNR
jgi:Protein of unknown function (DUF2905)